LQLNKASFNITSAQPVRVFIEYGIDGFTSSTTPTELGTTHTVALDSARLLPGTIHQYRIVTIDANGTRTDGEVQTFKTKGFTLKMRILGKNNKPLSKQKVVLRSEPMEATTDANGNVTFEDVAAGKHHIEHEQKGKVYSQALAVLNEIKDVDGVQTADVQNISVIYDDLEVKNSNAALYIAVLATLILAGLGAIIFARRGGGTRGFGGGQKLATVHSAPSSTASTLPAATGHTEANDAPIHKVTGVSNPAPGATLRPQGVDGDQ
jgi:hypothetical protein